MVERYAHVAPEALQGAASRLDAIAGYAAPVDPSSQPVDPHQEFAKTVANFDDSDSP